MCVHVCGLWVNVRGLWVNVCARVRVTVCKGPCARSLSVCVLMYIPFVSTSQLGIKNSIQTSCPCNIEFNKQSLTKPVLYKTVSIMCSVHGVACYIRIEKSRCTSSTDP